MGSRSLRTCSSLPLSSRRSSASSVGTGKPGRTSRDRPGVSGETARLLSLLVPVTLAAAAALVAAVASFGVSEPTFGVIAGVLALAFAATFVEAFPVPIEGITSGGLSLAAVFIVGAAVIYGWAPAVMIGFVARATIELVQRRPAIRLAYNSAVYALAGGAAAPRRGLAGAQGGVGSVLLHVLLAAAAFYAVNILLTRRHHRALVGRALPAASSSTPSARLRCPSRSWPRSASCWPSSGSGRPLLATALVGPLVAIALYQRSVHSALSAMRLALTDPLTGLGNHRHFQERLQHDLDRAQEEGFPLTLCLLDIDNFKEINDRYGHPIGDKVLAQAAARLRQGGEAFRLGATSSRFSFPAGTSTRGCRSPAPSSGACRRRRSPTAGR